VEDGMAVTRVWRPPRGALERRHYERDMTHLPFAYSALRRLEPDVAHAMSPTDALVAALWSERSGRPSLFTYRGIPDHRALTERRMRLRFITAGTRTRATCVQSEAAAGAFRRSLGAEARVIAPGVDLDAFRAAETRSEQPTIFCAADPSDPRTRAPLLVEAFERLRSKHPHARLQIVEPTLGHHATALRGPGIELVPPVAGARELARAYSRAWVTVLPSVGVGFPMSLLESLACGTPVVGADRDAVPELVDARSVGRLFGGDQCDLSGALLEAVELSLDDSTAAACRARAEELPIERCVDSYVSLYAELLEG
jgi:glycosyltransferase involved in cell wall biosynthesis